MSRSQDYMSHFYDDMFEDDYREGLRERRQQEERRQRFIKYLVTESPRRMLPILGCILGDVAGSRFERDYKEFEDLGDYQLIDYECKFTDDTVFTLGVADAFVCGLPIANNFTHWMLYWGRKYPNAGFGNSTRAWIASPDPKPYGSNRNGAAMRVSPCGCFAHSLDEALEYAKISAEVSHNTPEGVAGAQVIAAAVYMAINRASKDEIQDYIESHFNYNLGRTMQDLKSSWSGFSCKAEDTVPQAIICFLQSDSVESAIRNGISLCSDADTLAAMAASIAAPYYGYVPYLSDCLQKLPLEIIQSLLTISEKLGKLN